ncbi:MAG: response regulator receiver [Gallionellaceae bacterium]|nr:MAG: response regulator receiver [Gallionellaceae bacterium]
MRPVTVAIADSNCKRRAEYENSLRGDLGSALLTSVASSSEASNDALFADRRYRSRSNVTAGEDEVFRISRLKPRVLLISLDLGADEDCAMLVSIRRACPEALMVLLADDSVQEDRILEAMEIGVRGYLSPKAAKALILKAIQVVDSGEAWVPRKMLDKIMRCVVH